MSVLKPLNLNSLLGLQDPDAVDKFRDEFPHLYLPQDAGSGLYSAGSEEFRAISISLIVQHWLTADGLARINILEKELHRKEDGLYDARPQGYGEKNEYESLPNQVDPEFDKVKADFSRKAHEEAESYEDFDPDSDGEMGVSHHKIMDLAKSIVNDNKWEIMLRSFVGLRRFMNNGLKDVRNKWSKFKRPDWQDVEKHAGEADYVHLLRQLETNFPNRGISAFAKRSGTLHKLNSLRNDVEHENQEYDPDRHSSENLIEYFKEIKALMEGMERIDGEMVIWL